jgi:uncharacterized repeat protein (TIGR01451 family)
MEVDLATALNSLLIDDLSADSAADVAVTTSAPATIAAGSDIAYVITVANNGPGPAENVSFADTLPAGMTFVSASQAAGPAFTCTTPPVGGTGAVNCSIATLAAGASASFSLRGNASAATAPGTVFGNTATATADTPDPDAANNSATATSTVVAVAATPTAIPALSPLALVLLALAIVGAAAGVRRTRRL